jgi:hypothetical protein
MSNYEGNFREAGMHLYRSGEKVVCVISVEGHRGLGLGDTIPEAVEAAFHNAMPELKGVKMGAGAMMGMPKISDLPEVPSDILV